MHTVTVQRMSTVRMWDIITESMFVAHLQWIRTSVVPKMTVCRIVSGAVSHACIDDSPKISIM